MANGPFAFCKRHSEKSRRPKIVNLAGAALNLPQKVIRDRAEAEGSQPPHKMQYPYPYGMQRRNLLSGCHGGVLGLGSGSTTNSEQQVVVWG